MKSDCSGFGNYALKNFKTMQELENYNWLQHYQDSFFKVEPEVVVDSGFFANRNLKGDFYGCKFFSGFVCITRFG